MKKIFILLIVLLGLLVIGCGKKWDYQVTKKESIQIGNDITFYLLTLKEREETTFCIWYDGTIHQNNIENNNGGAWLLAYIFDTFERFQEFVTEYYSFEFDDQLLTKLYTEGTLSDRELAELTHEYQG